MKKFYILFLILFIGFNLNGQINNKNNSDTNQICMPYNVAQKILLDLNDYDKLKEIIPTYKQEISELNKKVEIINKENDAWKKDSELNKEIILGKNESIKIYQTENENLKKENKRLKTKNGLFNIISATIIVPLTYLLIIK